MNKTAERKRSPQPEMLGRSDQEHGRWVVGDSPATRGIPHTDLHERKMVAPHGEDELDRAIRAHEMMHAKVSPGPAEMIDYFARENASVESLRAVEEVRVNSLCNRVGIDVASHLTDSSENSLGKKLAKSGDIAQMVRAAVATAGTAGGKDLIKGVRSVDKGMAKVIASIQQNVLAQVDAVPSAELGRVATKTQAGGFAHTERIAAWVDSLIEDMENEREEDERRDRERESGDESDATTPTDPTGAEKPETAEKDVPETKKPTRREPSDPTKRSRPDAGVIPDWGNLRVARLPMPHASKGNLGKKRVASDTGKNPRRMHRYFTDRKIFDRTSKGMGGVVIIDASGSMSFEHRDVREIAEAAPGCTVAMYTERRDHDDEPNFWVLADKGRICKEGDVPQFRSGNVVDLPALKWAVKHKQRPNSPIVWVSDCQVSGKNDQFHPALNKMASKFVAREKILVVRNVKEAKSLLDKLKKDVGAGRPR